MHKSAHEPLNTSLLVLLLIASVVAAYWPTFHNQFIWDDESYIQNNRNLETIQGLQRIWFQIGATPQYYPLTFTTFWLEHHIVGAAPQLYHFDNVAIHVLGALALWRILVLLQIPGAFWAAWLFAIHPVQVESVAWATERKNVLSGLLYFLALLAYLHTRWGRKIWDDQSSGKTRWTALFYTLSLLLFCMALLSKTVTSTMPAVILLLLWFKSRRIGSKDVLVLLPFFIFGASMSFLTSWMEKHVVGAIGPDFSFSLLERFCIAGRAVWFYLGELLMPIRLTFIYPRWEFHVADHPLLLVYPLALFVCIAALWVLWGRLGRGPLVAVIFFLVTILPASGFFNVYPMRYSFVADHFQYLACVGPLVLIAALAQRIPRAPILFSAVIAAFVLANNAQAAIYFDPLALWKDTVARNPNSAMVRLNLGQAFFSKGDADNAEQQFSQAITLAPDEPGGYMGMGYCSMSRQDWYESLRWWTEALNRIPDSLEPVLHKRLALPDYHLGTVYTALSQLAQRAGDQMSSDRDHILAEQYLRMAVEIRPEYTPAVVDLGEMYIAENRAKDAIVLCSNYLAIDPANGAAMRVVGDAYFSLGQYNLALFWYRDSQSVVSNAHTLTNIGIILEKFGDRVDAINSFHDAMILDPNSKLARTRYEQALSHQPKQ